MSYACGDIDDVGTLSIGGVPMFCAAWRVQNLYAWWLPAEQRGSDRVFPGVDGSRPFRRRKAATRRLVELMISGEVDRAGNTYTNWYDGMQTNIADLTANVVNPVASESGTRTAVLGLPDGSVRSGPVHVLGLDISQIKGNSRFCYAVLDVSIPGGDLPQISSGASFTGGTITTYTDGPVTYRVHRFTSSGTLGMVSPGTVDYLVVGGGGAGGSHTDAGLGGGGAGGVLAGSVAVTGSVTVTVGAGGAAASQSDGGDGGNSVFGLISANGGGGGAGPTPGNGRPGGSGGGASNWRASYGGAGSGTAGQGNAGGNSNSTTGRGGGGGGAGSAGGDGTGNVGGNGGNGVSSSITGTAVVYAGGGGGGDDDTVALGGSGGGGNGATPTVAATSGAPNTGGGGGGGYTSSGGNGGSGIVIIRYPI